MVTYSVKSMQLEFLKINIALIKRLYDFLILLKEQIFKQVDDMMNLILKGFHLQDVFPSHQQIEEK